MTKSYERLIERADSAPLFGGDYLCIMYGCQVIGIQHTIRDGYEIIRAEVKDCRAMWRDWQPGAVLEVRKITPAEAESFCAHALAVGHQPRMMAIGNTTTMPPQEEMTMKKYVIEIYSEYYREWIQDGVGDPNCFDTEAEAEAAIDDLRELHVFAALQLVEFADADMRVREVEV